MKYLIVIYTLFTVFLMYHYFKFLSEPSTIEEQTVMHILVLLTCIMPVFALDLIRQRGEG